MATLIGGFATSHGPMLATPPDMWGLRGGADRKNPAHWYRGESMNYDTLQVRRAPGFAAHVQPDAQRAAYDRCQRALDQMADEFRASQPDMVIILGNDQREVFRDDLTAAFTIYTGSTIANLPLTPEAVARLPPGIAIAEAGHCPPGGAIYPGAPDTANALVTALVDQHVDVATSAWLPRHDDAQEGIPHAFGYVYRRIMRDDPPPTIPLFINVGVGLNTPRLQRCLDVGHALYRAIETLPSDLRVSIVASGGLTHFCIDETLDRQVLDAMQTADEAALAAIPETFFKGNTAEIKSWYPLVAAMNDAGRRMRLIDYVPCYRTEAGTGNAMGFASW